MKELFEFSMCLGQIKPNQRVKKQNLNLKKKTASGIEPLTMLIAASRINTTPLASCAFREWFQQRPDIKKRRN